MGSGYVGMSLAVLLAQQNDVVVLDVDDSRVESVNNKQSTVADAEIEAFLTEKELSLTATLNKHAAYESASFVVVATPTNYDPDTKRFDTSSVDSVVSDALELNSDALVVIKSTIPLGHTKSLQEKYATDRVIFSPEFLREGQALKDNLYPSRVIVGCKLELGKAFASLLVEGAEKKDIETLFISSTEAEAVKLFSNSYLAMRVAFFNELDSYASVNNLNSKEIIEAVCLDPRIGDGYNNPSFGYGGYCLPKDTKQLLANFKNVPQNIISAIVESNATRKNFIANEIINSKKKNIGIYRLLMKTGSDNIRSSSIIDIIRILKNKKLNIVIYEPEINDDTFEDCSVVSDLDSFIEKTDLIIANRLSGEIADIPNIIYTRDLFNIN